MLYFDIGKVTIDEFAIDERRIIQTAIAQIAFLERTV